jgi:hypothetical protein
LVRDIQGNGCVGASKASLNRSQILNPANRHHDARWVSQQLMLHASGTPIQRVFPHPWASRTVVIMTPRRQSWLPSDRAVDYLITKLSYQDRLYERHPTQSWPSFAPPETSKDPASVESVSTSGISLSQPKRVSPATYPQMEAAYERYEQGLERDVEELRQRTLLQDVATNNLRLVAQGDEPLPNPSLPELFVLAEDIGPRAREISIQKNAKAWYDRAPCWIRMKHGRYSGDIGILVGIADRSDKGVDRPTGIVFLVPRLPEYPGQPTNDTYSTITGKPRRRFARCHFNAALGERLFPAPDYTIEKNHDWISLCEVRKFHGQTPSGDPSLVEYLAGSASGRSFAFAVRLPWITEGDRYFSACPRPSDAEILDFDPFALGELFDSPQELVQFKDMVRPRHSAQAVANSATSADWDVLAGDRVRIIGGEMKGATGVVEDVFADLGIAHVRITDPGVQLHPQGHLSGACPIGYLDKDFLTGNVVSFQYAGEVLEGSVVYVDVHASEVADACDGLQRVHVFVREGRPLVSASQALYSYVSQPL